MNDDAIMMNNETYQGHNHNKGSFSQICLLLLQPQGYIANIWLIKKALYAYCVGEY